MGPRRIATRSTRARSRSARRPFDAEPDRRLGITEPSAPLFGTGAPSTTSRELERAGIARVRSSSSRLAARTRDASAAITDARQPYSAMRRCTSWPALQTRRAACSDARADGPIALGGGSPSASRKPSRSPRAADHRHSTTHLGSEIDRRMGPHGCRRKEDRDARVAPRTSSTIPLTLVAKRPRRDERHERAAHAVEALYAPDAHPLASLAAAEALRLLAHSLPRIVAQLDDAGARADALRAAYLAGTALDGTSMGLHHRLCHVLGGSFGLPHAPTHAVLLPYVVAFQQSAAPQAMAAIARAIGADDAAQGLQTLAGSIGVPASLAALGLARDAIPAAADQAARNPPAGPRPVTRDDIVRLLEMAFEGAHFVRR